MHKESPSSFNSILSVIFDIFEVIIQIDFYDFFVPSRLIFHWYREVRNRRRSTTNKDEWMILKPLTTRLLYCANAYHKTPPRLSRSYLKDPESSLQDRKFKRMSSLYPCLRVRFDAALIWAGPELTTLPSGSERFIRWATATVQFLMKCIS